MNKRLCVGGIFIILIAAAGIIYLQNFNGVIDDAFDDEGRYDSTILNNMGVIYNNQSNIHCWNNGYSESDNCPWAATHNGLDYMFFNDSIVIAAAPGLVELIELAFLEGTTFYKVGVHIRFNDSVWIEYGFEGLATDGSNRAQQAAMLDVEVGDWWRKATRLADSLGMGSTIMFTLLYT